jgi:membrane-associated protein
VLHQLLDILKDIPAFLDSFVKDYGAWVHALLFAIIFAETGLVVMPFLPGDSLLFAVGALAARPGEPINVWLAAALLTSAAVLGDAVNYAVGRWTGPRVFSRTESAGLLGRLLNRKHLDSAHRFFEKYGGKAVILARFVPIVRTFIPFVAGAGAMNYRRFFIYNVVGAVAWVGLCIGAGYAFGNIEFVQKNFEAVLIAIIAVSLIPLAVELLRERLRRRPDSAEKPPV